MPYLKFISDEDICFQVKKMLNTAQSALDKANNDLGRNVIDPFSIIFEMAGFSLTYQEWLKNETVRQSQKSLTNGVGSFHQGVLGAIKNWRDLAVGEVIDLENSNKRIIAEIKNKHNTVTGAKLVDLYDTLESLVMPKGHRYRGFTAYYVEIIPKSPKRYDVPFTPSDNKTSTKRRENILIRKIDGRSFYHIATGRKNALDELFTELPKIIEACSNGRYSFKELKKIRTFFRDAYGN